MTVCIPAHHVSSLEHTARRICKSRGGKWSGTKGMARCPAHKDRTPSLGVTLGRKAILFHCFAGCDQQSVLSALARDGFDAAMLFSGSSAADQLEPVKVRKRSAAALRIWREAEQLGASPAKAYLEGRGILAASSALRFHPRAPLGPKGRTRFLPAMIAAVMLDRRLADLTDEEREALDIDLSPREYVIDYLSKSFPVRLMQVFADEDGNLRSEAMSDEEGNPVFCTRAIAAREVDLYRCRAGH